jgi:hypothetical protein
MERQHTNHLLRELKCKMPRPKKVLDGGSVIPHFSSARGKAPAPTESTFVCLPGQYANSCSVNAGEVLACKVDGVVENLSVCEDADSAG